MANSDKVFVLHWEYGDKSAHGIEAIYVDEEKANEAYDLITKYDNIRRWGLDPYILKG